MEKDHENKLILKYQQTKAEDILEVFIDSYINMIFYFVRRYDFTNVPYANDDIVIELKIVLHNTMLMYNLDDVKFSVVLYSAMRHRVCRILRYYQAKKRKNNNQQYLESEIAEGFTYENILQDPINLVYELEKSEFYNNAQEWLGTFLTEEEMLMYSYHLDGLKACEIERFIQQDVKYIRAKLSSIKKKIKRRKKDAEFIKNK